MMRTIEKEARALMAQAPEPESRVITETHLAGLPEPIRRYLDYAQVVGKQPIRTVRLTQRGAMPLGAGRRWLPLAAEQYITTNPPAFLWHGTLHPLSLISVSATDTFADGHGTLVIKALSIVPLGTARGAEMDQGELLRYLGEMAWFPTALLSDDIHWEPIDSTSARATIALPGISASAVFHVDGQGRYTHVTAQRYRVEHKRQVLRPWTGRWDDYREINGLRIPMHAEASYTLESGEAPYFRAAVTEVVYNEAVAQ